MAANCPGRRPGKAKDQELAIALLGQSYLDDLDQHAAEIEKLVHGVRRR